jgi:diphosphomevalonate decarboxylase
MNLDSCYTICSVEFDGKFKSDKVVINQQEAIGEQKQRVVSMLDKVRHMARVKTRAEVISDNNFPTGTGIASSASAFSALSLAASKAVGINLSKKELSILARTGSGSACRSIVDGFAHWRRGNSSSNSYATQIASVKHWGLRDIVTIVNPGAKKNSSSEGHNLAMTSPYFKTRLRLVPQRLKLVKHAILERDFETLGKTIEEEAIELHVIAMTSKPSIFYWNPGTVEVINHLKVWRTNGIKAYFTMDAGANVHVLCLSRDVDRVNEQLKKLSCVQQTIINKPGLGTTLI